jgi:outer membrane protein OmpA-like peptidoglycan-associated protein/tetratricopeptide (TPR) repeat protein
MFDPYNMKTTSLSTFGNSLRSLIQVLRIFFLVLASILCLQAKSQFDKRLAMADQYYAAGDYYTAAGLYGQFLNPAVKPKYHSDFPLNAKRSTEGRTGAYQSKTDILFKQAESYRLAHYWMEACTLYQQCFEKDSSKYASALYWKAVCQRSLGEYNSAEESLDRFFNEVGQGNECYKAAVEEKETILFIRKQLARPDSVLYHIQKINTALGDKGIFAPVAVNNNQYLFTSTVTDSVAFNMNPYHNRLFSSELVDGSLQTVQPVSFESIDSSFNQGAASMSADGKYLYFTQWKKEGEKTMSSIYVSTKNNNNWSAPKYLGSVNQQGHSSKQPFCSSDGKYLFFASDRPGGAGGFDIWFAPILADGTTGTPTNAGAGVNSPANEEAPFYQNGSSSLVFASDREPGMGGYDLFTTKGAVGEWKTVENMGYPVNSSRDDVYFFATENKNLLDNAIVSSDRGSECCLSAYVVTKTPKKKIIQGIVVDCSSNLPLADAQVTMNVAEGKVLQTTTTADGRYSFGLTDDNQQHQFAVVKEKYSDKTTDVSVETIKQENWQTDTLTNAALCLEKKFVLKVENVVTVYFDFDKSDIKERGSEQLDSIYQVLSGNPSYTLQISGYTDGKGSAEYNKKLSDKRARSCADYLIAKGINPSRISFESFGACCPVEMELINGRDNEEGRSKNRRALININKPEEN